MKTSLRLASLLLVFAFFFGCGLFDNPTTALKSFLDKIEKKDIDGAAKFATKDSKTTLDLMKKGIEASKDDPSANKSGSQNYEFDKPSIDGSTATIRVTNKNDNNSMVFKLKKEDGDWKVDFTMETLMKMGMEKMKESIE
jgi:hypothetical protein